jgi:hypothetical protein
MYPQIVIAIYVCGFMLLGVGIYNGSIKKDFINGSRYSLIAAIVFLIGVGVNLI